MCSTCLFTQGHFHRLGGGLPISTPLAASFSPRAAACGQYLWPVAGSLGHCHFAPLDGRKLMGFHSGEIYPRYLSEYALPSDFIRPGSHARRLWHPRLDQRQRGLLLHGDFAGLFMWWTNVRLGLASPSRLAVLARFGALFVHWIPQLVGHPLLDSKIQQETFRFRQEGSFDAQRGFINTRASISLKLQLRKASFDFFHLFSMMLLRHVFRERYLFLPFSSLLWAASSNSFWGVDVWPVTGFCVSSYWLCLLGLELFCWTAFDQQVPWRQTGLGLGVGLGDVGGDLVSTFGIGVFSINGSMRFHKLEGPGPSIQDEVDKASPKLEAPRSLKHSHPKMEAPRSSKHTIDFFHFTRWCHHHHVNNDSSTVLIPSNTSCLLIPNLSSSGLPVLFLLLGFRSHPALI